MTDDDDSSKRYDVFHRTWWQPGAHGGRVPGAGRRHYLARDVSYDVARAMCRDWNSRHDPGFYSDKAEFESC